MKQTLALPRSAGGKKLATAFRLTFLSCLLAGAVQAENAYTWNGGSSTSGNWTDTGNWGGASMAPQAFINFDGSARLSNTNNFSSGSAAHQIYFKSTGGAFNLYGNGLTFYDFGGSDPNIQNEGTGNTQTINFPFANGNNNGTFHILNINVNTSPNQGPLTFNGAISSADANQPLRVINVYGPSAITFNGSISDFDSTHKLALSQLGSGTTTLRATNTFTGDLTVNAGTLVLATNSALANSTNFIRLGDTAGTTGANLNLNGGNTLATAINVRSGSSGGKIIANTSGTPGPATFGGNIFLDADVTLFANSTGGNLLSGATLDLKNQTLTADGTGSNYITGTLQNSTGNGNIIKKSAGTLTLTGNNTYAGTTTVNGGVLRVNGQTGSNSGTGTGAVTINPGGTLSGNGRIGGAVTVSNSATAGLYPNSGSTLTISNNLTIGGNSAVVKFDLSSSAGGANDKVVLVNGTLACGGAQVTLNLTNAALAASDYVLFDVGAAGTISGSFNSTPAFTGTTPNYSAGYSIVTVGKTVVLRYTPLSVTITNVVASGKVYDGTNTASLSGGAVSGLISPDTIATVTNVPGTGTFASKNIGTWAVTAAGFTLGGANASRYALSAQPIVANASISAKSVTITGVTASGKTYDRTNTASLSGGSVSGVISPDVVNVSAGTGTFASKNIGTWAVTTTGYGLTGTDAGNYLLPAQPTVPNATISAKGVTIIGLSANDKVYDGTNTATLSGTPSLIGVISPDSVTIIATSAAATFANANAGLHPVTVTGYALGGADAGNYSLSAQPVVANATITQAGTTLGLTTSAIPRSQPGSNVTFTATLTATPGTATGGIQFLTNGVAAGSPVGLTGLTAQFSTGTLPPGTNSITAQYAGDGNFTGSTNSLNQVVNHLPVANNVSYYRGAVNSFKIKLSDLVTNVTDLDGDSNSITGFGTSTNGVTLTTGGGFAMYYNTNLVNDQFTYTVSDGFGGGGTGTITLTAQAFLTGQNATVSIGGGTATVHFSGIPGYGYSVQRSTNLIDWAVIRTTNAPANGQLNFTDDFSDLGVVPSSAYYRLQYNP
ncbi:MAG: YDG domain-containing protein [Verrucomicrobiae bacterium]|nr:YDG domain-containing protein [Verrucomicrobiae bacterium]